MQITQVTQIELALLINGLRAFHVQDGKQQDAQAKLLKQLEGELTQRFGLKLRKAGADLDHRVEAIKSGNITEGPAIVKIGR